MPPERLKPDNHYLLNSLFTSLEVHAFLMRGKQGACVVQKLKLDFKASYGLKLVTKTTKRKLKRNGYNRNINTIQTNIKLNT